MLRTAPNVIGDELYHSAYRSHLLAKDMAHYSQFGWDDEVISGYYAPDKNNNLILYSRK